MKIMLSIGFIIVVVFGVCSAGIAEQSTAITDTDTIVRFLANSDDNSLAASKLFAALRAEKLRTNKNGDEALNVEIPDAENPTKTALTVIVEPKLSKTGLDRISFVTRYRIKWDYKHSNAVKEMIWNANRTTNAAQYSIDENGNLRIRVIATFIDAIQMSEIKAIMDYMSGLPVLALSLVDADWPKYME